MPNDRTVGWLVTAVATGIITLVGAFVVFVGPTPTELLLAALAGWVPLFATVSSIDTEPNRISRFLFVFCGSLVGFAILVGNLTTQAALETGLSRLATLEFAVPVNPVMAILVGGALAISYFAVFEWDDATAGNERRAI